MNFKKKQNNVSAHLQLPVGFSSPEWYTPDSSVHACIRKYLHIHASLCTIMCICDLCVSLHASLNKVAVCAPIMSSL